MGTLQKEATEEFKARQGYEGRLNYLASFCGIKGTSLGVQEKLSALARKVKSKTELRKEYQALCIDLDFQFKNQKSKTAAEDAFRRVFASEFKFKLYPQTWIGNFCVDFFTPAVGVLLPNFAKGYSSKGLAFEIDGPIHDQEQKMKKDQFKEKYLWDLNIQVWRLSNEQVYGGFNTPKRQEFFRNFHKLCSRERGRIWSKVHLLTLLRHRPEKLYCLLKYGAHTCSVGRKS